MATAVVRGLVDREGLPPTSVVLVVNGEGGLDDPDLEGSVRVVRLPANAGPAGGFRAGILEARRALDTAWYYLCEDDVGLFDLPSPRLAPLLAQFDHAPPGSRPVGAVVAYGRDLDLRTGLTTPHQPTAGSGALEPVDVAAWGASLISRRVFEAGVLPDARWFFGYEDFDFFLRVAGAGFDVLLDTAAARATEGTVSGPGRDAAFAARRPGDRDEPWRAYYQARNLLELRRRYGRPTWTASHLIKSVRRTQLAGTRSVAVATAAGLADGFRGRLGKNPAYQRDKGEL